MLINFIFNKIATLQGWKWVNKYPKESRKCVLMVAPHTSNWDLVYGLGVLYHEDMPIKFAIKKEWVRFPIKKLLKEMGAVAIDRNPKNIGEERKSMVQVMIEIIQSNSEIAMTVTPEGTRGRNAIWKTGFWHVAKAANVPICLAYIDYKKKEAGIFGLLYPNELESDMKIISSFYKDVVAKKPENFVLDSRYM
jgi:1-acyl-sn-glycerol-3-phosphate acyltransferase